MINQLTIVGYVGQDPDYVSGAFEANRATFAVATSDTYKKKDGSYVEHTFWHDCTAWGLVADRISKFVKKGSMIMVQGKLTYWEQEKEGFGKVKRANVKIDSFWVLKEPRGVAVQDEEQKDIIKKVNGTDFENKGRVNLPDNKLTGVGGDAFDYTGGDDGSDDLPF